MPSRLRIEASASSLEILPGTVQRARRHALSLPKGSLRSVRPGGVTEGATGNSGEVQIGTDRMGALTGYLQDAFEWLDPGAPIGWEDPVIRS